MVQHDANHKSVANVRRNFLDLTEMKSPLAAPHKVTSFFWETFFAPLMRISHLGCSGGLRRIQCSADPCTMNSCPGVSNAECRPNYCGGCHAEFYYPGTNRRIPEYLCVEKGNLSV